jgi:hypothetical protein
VYAGDGPRNSAGDGKNERGLPYFHPHSFRKTLGILGEKICPTPEAFKAWSQNLGHSHVLTTFMNYGTVAQHRQDEIMSELAEGTRMHPGPRPHPMIERLDRIEKMLRAQHREGHCDLGLQGGAVGIERRREATARRSSSA